MGRDRSWLTPCEVLCVQQIWASSDQWGPRKEVTGAVPHLDKPSSGTSFHCSSCIWDRLGPRTLGCSAHTWTNVSLSNRMQRNYKGLKITACVCSWGNLWTTKYKKTKNPTATSKVLGSKAGYCPWSLHIAPPGGWADHLSHPSSLNHGPTPTLTPFKGPACPLSASEQGNLLRVFIPLCCSMSPSTALPEFLVWPLISFYWLRCWLVTQLPFEKAKS